MMFSQPTFSFSVPFFRSFSRPESRTSGSVSRTRSHRSGFSRIVSLSILAGLFGMLFAAVPVAPAHAQAGSDNPGAGSDANELETQWKHAVCRVGKGLNMFRVGIMFLGIIGIIWIGINTVMDKFNKVFAGRLFAFFVVLGLAGYLMVYLFPGDEYNQASGYIACGTITG